MSTSRFCRCIRHFSAPSFTSDFREKQQNKIELQEKKEYLIQSFLEVLYQHYEAVNERNCEDLLALADEYQAGLVKKQCRKFMNSKVENGEDCLKYYRLASQYGLADVRKKALTFAKNINFLIYREAMVKNANFEIVKPKPNINDEGMIMWGTRWRLCADKEYKLLEEKDKVSLLENRVSTLAEWIEGSSCEAALMKVYDSDSDLEVIKVKKCEVMIDRHKSLEVFK